MKRLFAAVGACVMAVGLALAGAPTAPGVPTPQALVEQLGADRYADREAAAAALEAIGAPAVDALRAGLKHDSPEVRARAAGILIKLKRGTDSAARLVARRTKLDYKDIPLGTAINDLRIRTGLPVALDPNKVANPLRKITCETADLPVWEAFEAFCAAAGLREIFVSDLDVPKPVGPRRGYVAPPQIPNADQVAIVLADGKPERLPGDRATAVRVLALPARFPGHKVTLGTGEITLCLDITPAPGLNWQEFVGFKVTRMIDSSDRAGSAGTEKSPPPANDPNGMVVFARPGLAMRFDYQGNPIPPETVANPRVTPVPLRLGTPSARSLKRFEGAVYGEVHVLDQHLLTVAEPKKNTGTQYTAGDLKLTVLDVKEAVAGGVGTMRVQLEFPSPWIANARRRGWNPGWPEPPRNPGQGNRVVAFDAAGQPFPITSQGYTDLSDDGMVNIQTTQFSFRAGSGVPAKVALVGPKTVLVEVPFLLENVPLP